VQREKQRCTAPAIAFGMQSSWQWILPQRRAAS
jgi:hypothetical protein